MANVLYISYDGMLEPLGQSQVLGYVERLATEHRVAIVSFEKEKDRRDAGRAAAMRERLRFSDIDWTPLPYHKAPSAPATAYDIAVGTAVAIRLARRHQAAIVHARSYVPALMALAVKKVTGARFLFDMRGFWADERVDGGLWPRDGQLYRTAKRLEQHFLQAADHIVTLTHASEIELHRFAYLQEACPPISVIPTCADLDRFSPQAVDPNRPFTFGYVGSIGTWYLFDEMLGLFRALQARRPDARLLVVNRNENDQVRALAERAGISGDRVEVVPAEHREVPALISQMHFGGALIKPSYSKMSSAPTKLAEYLGCGVPCVGNVRVGDMEEILEGHRVGLALKDFSPASLESAADHLLAMAGDRDLPARCVATARDLFSLDSGVAAYRKIYEALAHPAPRVRRT